MTPYQYVTAQHGNETIPVGALALLRKQQFLANPQAFAMRRRFIDQDMNACFGKTPIDYETTLAQELLQRLSQDRRVVDLHTFTSESPPFVIIVDKEQIPLAKKTSIRRVVYMKHNIKAGHALINYHRGISVEVGQHTSFQAHQQTIQLIHALESDKDHLVDLYEVYDVINETGKYSNFQLYNSEFYPVLSGENAYQHFGLKAKKVKEQI